MRTWQRNCLLAVLLMAFTGACLAQASVTPEDEYKQLIKVDQDIQPLGATPFGESVSLYDGTLSFEETDVSMAGNGPLIQLSRSLQTTSASSYALNAQRPFGDWELDIPRIETVTADQTNDMGWQVSSGATAGRCSLFGGPPSVNALKQGDMPWQPRQWWYGYHLIVPGQGSQELMGRSTQNTLSPTMPNTSFPIVTKQNWMIACGVQADDGGEGFLAVAPDGTQYTFSHLIYRPMATISSATDYVLERRDALMLVTQVKDRFGNTVAYNYDGSGRLANITASDGRQLTLQYVGATALISTVTESSSTASPRTWTYSYDTSNPALPTLTGVRLPDGSAWAYQLKSFETTVVTTDGGNCQNDTLASMSTTPATGTITHPSGLQGTFVLKPVMRGRSQVTKQCFGDSDTDGHAPYTSVPNVYYQLSLSSKSFAGAGLSQPETWTYSYSPANQSWTTDTCGGTCPTTVYTDVLDPEGHDVRYTSSNVFDATEGQLLRTDYYAGAAGSTLLRSELNGYADPVSGPWPATFGIDPQGRDNKEQVTELSPSSSRQILQDGDTYTWQAEAFNVYAQVTQAKRSNSFSNVSLEESTSYLNDTNLWVLGLPSQITNVGTGEVESANTYAGNDTLLTRSRFGQQLMSYTFNTAGQLASFTDGNSHTTSLGSYKRGIPQSISYPDSTSETLVVDDFGQISSITDQAGHATSYGYDGVGRVTSVNYPGGDETAWAPQSFTYTFVTSAERGLAANHWKRTGTLGSANTVTYFDAVLRPVLSDSDIGSAVQASTLSTYDSKGQKLFSAYPSASALSFTQTPSVGGSSTTYDALGRATQVQQTSELGLLTTGTAYLSGARQQVTDPKGNVTTTSYQVFDEPTYDKVIQVAAPTSITQTIVRDVYGNPQSITQSGPTTTAITKSLVYDNFKRLCRTTEPESHSEIMHYDAANNLDWSIAGVSLDPSDLTCGYTSITGGQTARTYDAMNRLVTIQPPSSAPIATQGTAYGYDNVGRMVCAITNPTQLVACNPQTGVNLTGSNAWIGTYNFRGMLTGESLQVGTQAAWGIGYAHDANGNLSLIHYPDGENVSYAPDALGRPTQVGSYATGIGYWPNGQVSGFMFGNGTGYTLDQNDRKLVLNFSYTAGSTPQVSEDFSYDNNANIVGVSDLAGTVRNKSFGYDALNRLTSASDTSLWGTQSYTYDALNNLLTLTTNSQTANYSYANNLLTGISGAMTASYVYDAQGNVQNKSGTPLSFDLKNQLLSIGSGGAAENFEYDAAGRRVKKSSVAGGDTYYFYNQAGQLMYQTGPGVLNSTDFIYLGTKLIARDLANAPTVSSPALSNNGSFTVSWAPFFGATTYTLQERVNSGAWNTIQSGSATASAIAGKAAGSYSYQVQACNATTCSQWSNVATTSVVYPPAAPASISVPATSTGVVAVSWSASATATSYTLQHRFGAGGWGAAYSGAGTSTSIAEGATGSYTYQVQACNAGGCSAFKLSSAVAVTIPPSAATAVSVAATSYTGSYTVSWGGVGGATSYTLQEQVNGGGWTTILTANTSNDALSNKSTGTYGYRVQGCNAGGCGPWSGTGTIAVTRIPAVPSPPTLSVSGAVNKPVVHATWTAVPGATSYQVEETNPDGMINVTIVTGTTASQEVSETGTVKYRLEACNVAGCSAYSDYRNKTVQGGIGIPPLDADSSEGDDR